MSEDRRGTMKLKIGFNTGGFDNISYHISKESINFLRSIGCNAIELHAFNIAILNNLNDINKSDFEGFEYVSIHAPHSNNSSEQLIKILDLILHHHKRLCFDTIVMHPIDIEDFGILRRYDLPIALENMDWRKSKYRDVEDMKALFKEFDYPMVFDIQHAYTNDPSGALADEFSAQLGKRMSEIHLSGIDEKKDHCMLHEKKQSDIIRKVPKNIPIIIESYAPQTGDLKELANVWKKELNYIKENLR